MDKTINLEMTKDQAEQLKELLNECLAAMDRANEQMVKDNLEIEQSQARTWAILANLPGGMDVERVS